MAERTLDGMRAQYLTNWEATAGTPPGDQTQLTSVDQALAPVENYGAKLQRGAVNKDTKIGLGVGLGIGLSLALFFATHGAPELAAAVIITFTAGGGAGGHSVRRGQA